MAYTTVTTVVAGNKGTATWGNGVAAAAGELQTAVPQAAATWTSPVNAGITLGNGVQGASYAKAGGLIVATYRLVLGGTSAITGALTFNLPANALIVDGVGVTGQLVDVSAPATFDVMLSSSSATTVTVAAVAAGGTYTQLAAISSTVPFTWASTDEINLTFTYLAA